MLPRDDARTLAQSFGTKYLAPDWTDELLSRSGFRAAKEASKSFRGLLGWDYCRHKACLTPKMCLGSQIIR
jgi:hypothetical protein